MSLENLYTIAASIIAGNLYGYLFIASKTLIWRENRFNEKSPLKTFLLSSFFSGLRMSLIGLVFFFILRTQLMSIILISISSFLAGFWVVIVRKKAHEHEQY